MKLWLLSVDHNEFTMDHVDISGKNALNNSPFTGEKAKRLFGEVSRVVAQDTEHVTQQNYDYEVYMNSY